MRKYYLFVILSMMTLTVQAQKVTFASPAFEQGVREHLQLADGDDILLSQTDTITSIDLSHRAISDVRDVIYLSHVRQLDLSGNSIIDVEPLIVLDSLSWLDIGNNQLESIDILVFTHAKKMWVNVADNFISDFSLFFYPAECQFTLRGMGMQIVKDAPYLDIYQFYADVRENGIPCITYRAYTNIDSQFYVECGSKRTDITLDGTLQRTDVPGAPKTTSLVYLTNGEQNVTTYVVPPVDYFVDAGKTITLETGLPEDYHLYSAYASKGIVEIEGTTMKYTAPETAAADIIYFSYYQDAVLKGFSRFYVNRDTKGDVNGDGDVDIADAVCIVNHVVDKPNTAFIEAAADANGDGDIDIADAVHIVNLVVGKITALAPRFEWNLPEPE